MKHKYIEEAFPRYFIFGEYDDGYYDVSTVDQDIASHISKQEAKALIASRDRIVDALIFAINANGSGRDYEVFSDIMNGKI